MPMSSVPGAANALPARYRLGAALAAYVERARPVIMPPNPPAPLLAPMGLTARAAEPAAPAPEEAVLVIEVDGTLYAAPRRDGTPAGDQWRTFPDMAPVDPPITGHAVR